MLFLFVEKCTKRTPQEAPSAKAPGSRKSCALTCLSLWTDAGEGSHPVDAGGAVGTGGSEAVVDVLAAVVPAPAVDTDAGVAPVVVGAGAPVLAGIGLELAFVHVLRAKLAWGTETSRFIGISGAQGQGGSCTGNRIKGNSSGPLIAAP